ncbi:MAG: 3-oxoacyl-[acyl-carrier-protein] synthase III C-terminal domain-containing protein [Fuerstiella sp.]
MASEVTLGSGSLKLSTVVDVFDDGGLFRALTNRDVMAFSRQGGQPGFSSTKAILRSTGIRERRVLQSDVTIVDLAEVLCEKLESATGMGVLDFQHVVLCHSHTDPKRCEDVAEKVERRLNLPQGVIIPRNFGCSGYMKLLAEGRDSLMGLSAGGKVALLSVETPQTWHDSSDRLFCGIVSAGATASVLELEHGLPIAQIHSGDYPIPDDRRLNPDPLFVRDHCDGFDFDGQACCRTVMRMNAEPVFINGIELMLEQLQSALEFIDADDPVQRIVVIPHQPSGKLLKALVAAAKAKYDHIEFVNNLEWYGNTISSTVPTILARLPEVFDRNQLDPLQEGDHVILLAAGICMSEIGGHMSAGHACLRWAPDALNVVRPREAVGNAG